MTVRKEVLAEGVELFCGDCIEVLPTLGREDRRAELERWKRSPAMRAGMARFCDVFAHVLAQQ